MRPKVRHFFGEVYRGRAPLMIAAVVIGLKLTGILSPASEVAVLLYKLSLLCVGSILALIVVQQLFPYVDLGDWVEQARSAPSATDRQTAAIVLVGLGIMRGLIFAAILLGLSMGL